MKKRKQKWTDKAGERLTIDLTGQQLLQVHNEFARELGYGILCDLRVADQVLHCRYVKPEHFTIWKKHMERAIKECRKKG